MTTRQTKAILCGFAVGLITAQSVWAAGEAAPAPVAAPAQPAMTGPLVPGVCLLSNQGVVSRAKIGVAASARLEQLTHASQTEFNGEKASLEARAKALSAKRATLPPAQLQAQGQALNQRYQALQAQASVRSGQLDAARARATARVIDAAQPFVVQAFAAHGCGLLLAREAVLGGNLGNDLTGEVVTAMDAKATPIAIELEPAR